MAVTDQDGSNLNAVIRVWNKQVTRELRQSASWFDSGKTDDFITRGTGSKIRTEGKLVNSISPSTKESFGEIDTIRFTFERHGVFVHKGVGRGWKKSGQRVTRTAKGPMKNGGRNIVEWFNPILDARVPDLADIVAESSANAVLNASKMKI